MIDIEYLDITCGYLLKNESEIKKEVREIMRPIFMTPTERAEYEIEKAIRKLIMRVHNAGQNYQKTKECIQYIFSPERSESRGENGEILDAGK